MLGARVRALLDAQALFSADGVSHLPGKISPPVGFNLPGAFLCIGLAWFFGFFSIRDMSDTADFTLSLIRTLCLMVLTFVVCAVAWDYFSFKREMTRAFSGAPSLPSPRVDSTPAFTPERALEDIRKESARRALGIASKASPPPAAATRDLDTATQSLTTPAVGAMDQYLQRMREQQRLDDQRRAEEKARIDGLPNGPRQR